MSLRIISGKYKGHKLVVPGSDKLKPTTSRLRESLFNSCQAGMVGSTFLDLFAGAGAMGLEALSRGAKEAYFVEHEKRHSEAIRANIAHCKAEKEAHLLIQDVFKALEFFIRKGTKFDYIFADPPYGTKEHSLSNAVLKVVDRGDLLTEDGTLFLEDLAIASHYEGELHHLIERKVRNVGKVCLREYCLTI